MSYLNALRLHFAGQFQADISTVNNDPAHFWNAMFQPNYQELQGPSMNPPNGWFSPQGDAAFRLRGCRITSAWMSSGQVTAADPVLGFVVADSDSRAPAKLVDLDSEQQLVSEIWGLQVRIADGQGNTLLRGDFEPAAFIDLWDRALAAGSGGDTNGGAMYQSVLGNLQWGNIVGSPFLTALRGATENSGLLSIKFNLDGINMTFSSPDFMCGRIAGTIGPAHKDEPRHLVIGRQFVAVAGPNPNFFNPLGGINDCVAVVDQAASCIYLDLGNALRTSTPGSGMANLGDLTIGIGMPLGIIPALGAAGYARAGWYERTAGVVVLPLTQTQLRLVADLPMGISGNVAPQPISISEWSNGAFVRADRFVYRLSPAGESEQTVQIPIYAMQLGKPLASVEISCVPDSSQLQPQVAADGPPYIAAGPNVATPPDVLVYGPTRVPINITPPTLTTHDNGCAVLEVYATDPGNVRWFNNGRDFGIDGQVYGIRPSFLDPALNTGPVNQWNFISFLVWSSFTPADPVSGTDVYPIFQQYANLYPVMKRFLNLDHYESVVAHTRFLLLAFGLDPADPNAMPVTRDLSPAKRAAIVSWLQQKPPERGNWPAKISPPACPSSHAIADRTAIRGGKSAAAARRLVRQKR
jgi:hypothetical protein